MKTSRKYLVATPGLIKSAMKMWEILPIGEIKSEDLRKMVTDKLNLTFEQIQLRIGYLKYIGKLTKGGKSIYVKNIKQTQPPTVMQNKFLPTIKKITDFSTSEIIQELKARSTDSIKYEILKIEKTIL